MAPRTLLVSATTIGLSISCLLTGAASAAGVTEPIFQDGVVQYPEGAAIGRAATPIERHFGEEHPLSAGSSTGPPSGPIHCVAEYEPMEGLLISWEGPVEWTEILAQIAARVTTIAASKIYCVIDTASEQPVATARFVAWGANMDRVEFIIRTTDTIWIRDYGPRYIYEGQCRAIVDHTYNIPSRVWDNALPSYFALVKNQAYYEIPLIHGGGNYHLNALGRSNATELVLFDNPGMSETTVRNLWAQYQNVSTAIWDMFPGSVDGTGHIDMWMQILDDDVIVISDWPNNPGSVQDVICDSTASSFTAQGWNVFRTPARNVGGTHYTYTNMVICNNLILVPSYTNAAISPWNIPALDTIRDARPDLTVLLIPCEDIVWAAGVIHCIVMHVPVPLGGENPTAYLKNLRGGETLNPGQLIQIQWISDDDVGTDDVDILLSTNGGASFDVTITAATADDGTHTWQVPDLATSQARLRVVVHDGDGNTGSDESDGNITITGTPIPGDLNGDAFVTFADLLAMLGAWGPCPDPPAECPADLDDDGSVGFSDLLILLGNWS